MRTISEVAEDIKSILNNVERTEECTGETLVDINELVDEILAINCFSNNKTEIRNKAIDEFAEQLKDLIAKNVEDAESSNDLCCEIFQSEIDEIAEQMKGGE